VESMRQISNPARSRGVATAKIPKGAVASELANDGKKKTILRDLDNGFSSLRKTIDTPQNAVVTGMSAICQVSAATAGGDRTGVSGRPAGSWLPCAAGVGRGYGRRRVEKGFGKMCALSALSRRPGARGSRWVARGGVGAGSAQAWGSLSGRQTRVLPLGAAVGPVYRMVTCLRSRLCTFPLADSKNIFGVLAPGAGGGLRVRENALNEGHQACRTTKPIDEGFSTRGTLFYCPPQVARGNFV
jgi:hypothetical protein